MKIKLTLVLCACFHFCMGQMDTYVGIGPALGIFHSDNLDSVIQRFNARPTSEEMEFPSVLKGAAFKIGSVDDFYFEYDIDFLMTKVNGSGVDAYGDPISAELKEMLVSLRYGIGYPFIDEAYFVMGGAAVSASVEFTSVKINNNISIPDGYVYKDVGFNTGIDLFLVLGYTITETILLGIRPAFSVYLLGNPYSEIDYALNQGYYSYDDGSDFLTQRLFNIKLFIAYNY